MSTKKIFVIGCSALAGLALLAIIVVVAGFAYFAQDPQGVTLSVERGTEARQGEEFELIIRIVNERAAKPFKVGDIDIAEGYLKGFVLVSSDPVAKSSHLVAFDGSQSFTFDISVPARSSRAIKFKLRPVQSGFFKGDVDVYEGLRYVTTVAETEVK